MENTSRKTIAAAAFDDRESAERAIQELRQSGVPDSKLSVLQLHKDQGATDQGGIRDEELDSDNKGSGTAKGLATGGAVGAIAGLAALLIPGVGPFIAAGALAETLGVAGSAAVTSGLVGAAAGGLSAALIDYGVDREDAEYYERRVREGAVLVAVDTSDQPSAFEPTMAIMRAAGGESARREEAATS